MLSFLMVATMALSALTIAMPTTSPIGKARTQAGFFADCIEAPNCEVFIDTNNRTLIRFKEGMGPTSNWYHENVRLAKRQYDSNFHYNMDITTKTTTFGNIYPQNAVGSMQDNCVASGCDSSNSWTLDAFTTEGNSQNPGKLRISANAEWDASTNEEGYWIQLLQMMIGQDDSYTDSGYYSFIYQSEESSTQWTAPKYLNANRYSNDGNLQGYAQIFFNYQDLDDTGCDAIFNALSQVAGDVPLVGGGFSSFFASSGAQDCDN